MTDTSLTRSPTCNLILLAILPTGDFVANAFALDDRTLPGRDGHQQAAIVQRELIVVSTFRRYIATADRRADHIKPDLQYALLGLSLDRLVAARGRVTDALRSYLIDADLDLTPEFAAAAQMQASNALPADVPPLGRIMTKASTAIAGEDTPMLDPLAMKALLMAQACLRAVLPVEQRKPELLMRPAPSDPLPLRLAQELANKLLLSTLPANEADAQRILDLSSIAEELLMVAGLKGLAQQMRDLRAHHDAKSAVSRTIISDGGCPHAAADR